MSFLFTITVFLIILFCYIYIMHQYGRSEDLEMYEMDYTTNQQLHEVCDVRQPMVFLMKDVCPKIFQTITPNRLLHMYPSYDLQVKNIGDYFTETPTTDLGTVPLPLGQTVPLIEQDIQSKFVTDTNSGFLEETGLLGQIKDHLDPYLKPTFTVHSHYDLLMGANGTVTPFVYHTYYRRFLQVTSGKIRLRMSPWKHSKHMHPIKDYEHYEFRSPVHPTGPSPEYLHDFERMSFLEFDVEDGYSIFIPPYWWYSIEYISPICCLVSVSYASVMNIVANLPDIALYWLQQQNITHKVSKPIIEPVYEKEKEVVVEHSKVVVEEPIQTHIPFTEESETQSDPTLANIVSE